jgi:hypothetical protein
MPADSGSIYDTLNGHLSGTTLTLGVDVFPGGIADVLAEYFAPDGTLVIDGVHLARDGEAVTFADATGVSAPLAGMTITARFAPGGDGNAVVLTLTAVPPDGWLLSHGWPLLAGGPTDQFSFSATTLTLSSVSVPNGPAKGLGFAGTLGFPAAWQPLLWLLGDAPSVRVSGPVEQRGTAPGFTFTAPVGSVDMPVLGTLSVRFVCTSVIVAGPKKDAHYIIGRGEPPADELPALAAAVGSGFPGGAGVAGVAGGDPVYPPWVPQTTIGVAATIHIAGTPVQILVDLSDPGAGVPITADTSKLSLVALTDLAAILDGTDLSSELPPKSDFDPGQWFGLDTLSFTLNPRNRKLVSAGFTLSTHKAWPITNGLSAGPVTFSFLVGFDPKMVIASLAGPINFPGGSFALGAFYPGWVFTGGLTPGSTVNLSELISKVLNNTPIGPKLILSELDVVVQPLNGGSFSLQTEVTGDWTFPVGTASLSLTRAYLDLSRQSGGTPDSGTSGSIGMSAELKPPSGSGDPITFDGTWNIPGSFELNGKFPNLDLTVLASKVTGTPVPQGVPDVALHDGVVAIVLNTQTGEYSFALATSASINGTPVGSAMFAARKTQSDIAFLIGLVVTEGWSPAHTWPELAEVFGGLTFKNSGLLVSTLPAGSPINLPNLKMPSLPASVSPGFTFFSTLELKGAILGSLAPIFDAGVTLDLLAVVDTSAPVNSVFQAIFKGSSVNKSVAWTDIVVTIKPGAGTFTVKAGAVFTIEGEKLTLAGEGTIALEPPAATFSLLISNWVHPFGIENLVVKQFGLQVGVKGEGVTIGLLGAFVIGTGARTFTLVVGGELIDFEVPGALIFQLDSNDPLTPLMLTDVIKQFTQLDLSSVPLLNAIGFKQLDFAVVDDPNGFTIGDYHFPPGIGIAADIFFYSWEAKFNLQVSWGKGIIASGSINDPIALGGDILIISNVDGTKGPSGSIDTTHLPRRDERRALEERRTRLAIDAAAAQPYFTLDGRLRFLGIDESVKASATGKSFDFEVSFKFLELVRAQLACQLADATHFSASAAIGFDLDVTLGPYSVAGIELIPQVHIDGPAAALALGIRVDPSVIFELGLGLKFSWGNVGFSVDFTLSAADIAHELTNLWNALITWLKNNVGKLFADLLDDVTKWIEALFTIFKDLALDIAKVADALANFFLTTVYDAAAFLKQLGYAFMAIVDAIVEFFKVALDVAYQIVEAIWGDCSMASAQQLAYDATALEQRYTLPDLAFQLTRSPAGQRLLLLYYRNADELTRLLAPHPYLHEQLRLLVKSYQQATDIRLMCDTAVRALLAVAPDAGPQLSADIDELIPLLMRYREMTPAGLLADLAAA